MVTHRETGEDVKIKKSFHGATEIDSKGRLVSGKPPIDKNDFDMAKTIVDK